MAETEYFWQCGRKIAVQKTDVLTTQWDTEPRHGTDRT